MSERTTGRAPVTGAPTGEAPHRTDGGAPRGAFLKGSRAVWIPAAVIGAIMLALTVWQLTLPRDFYTGTNSVGVRSVVADVNPGQTLCIPDLSLPAETGRVQLAVFAHRPTFTGTIRVTAAGQTSTSTITGSTATGILQYASASIPRRPASPATVPATVCLSPKDGLFELGGMIGLQGNQTPAKLGAEAITNRIGVWFLPPAGVQRSLLSSASQIFKRAALFRPGIVGPWTYPVLLLVVLPLLWAAALLLLARAATGRELKLGRRRIPSVLAIALIAFVNAGCWALITPAFNGPDEPDHFAYAQYFAETGHAPSHNPDAKPAFSSDEALAMEAVNVYSQVSLTDSRPPWLAGEQERWEVRRDQTPHPADNGGGATEAASPHQPAYYALLAPAYELVRSQSTFSQITAMRLVSALLGAIVAMCAFGIVRELLPRWPVAAAAAGLLVAFHPMFGFISGVINNDSGINAAAALALYLVIRALRRRLTLRLALALGATLAVAPLMKETGYEIYPAIAVGLVGVGWRSHRAGDLRVWAGLIVSLLGVKVVWSLLQPVFYPAVAGQPGSGSGSGGVAATSALSLAEHLPGRFMVYLWELFLPRLSFMGDLFPPGWPFKSIYVVRGWGAFGWYEWTFPNWVYNVIILAMGAVGLLVVSASVRERVAIRARLFEVAVIALYPVCVLVAVEAAFFDPTGGRTVVAEQGRYLFPAIAALSAIAIAGTFGLGRRWHVPLATVLVVAMIGLSYASQLLTLGSFYT